MAGKLRAGMSAYVEIDTGKRKSPFSASSEERPPAQP
jgi:hypothetical protein